MDQPSGLTASLGDTSKLAFLDDVPLNTEPENTPPSPPPQAAASSKEASSEVTNSEVDSGNIPPLEVENNVSQVQQPPAAPNLPVDYKDIDPADVPLFKRMDNTAKAAAKQWYDFYRNNKKATEEYQTKLTDYEKELNELREYRYYQAPDAYKLAPDYTTAVKSYQTNDAIVRHWTDQLAAIDEGRPIRDLLQDKDGNLTLSAQELQPSPQLRAQVLAAMQTAISKRDQAGNNLESFPSKYQERNKQFSTQLEQAVNQLASPTLMQNPAYKNIYDAYLTKAIPSHLRNVPVYQQMAKMAAFVQLASKQIQTLQAQLAAKGIKTAAAVNQGPPDGAPANGDTSSGGWGHKRVDDIYKEFQSLKYGV